jgi:predicted metal-dependent enzyme (double-stranded beta helix superfamily)
MNMIARRPLDAMLAAIADAAATPLAGRETRVAAALAPHLRDPLLLAGLECPGCETRYTRHLLHEGDGYAVVALVWRPGQMSPVHAHKAWCALGIHQGILTEHYYAAGTLRPTAVHLRIPGDVSHGPACDHMIHRLANCCAETAISIHVYGTAFARMAEELNLVLA